MVFPKGERDANVETISDYCIRMGKKLRNRYLSLNGFNVAEKKNELRSMLRIKNKPAVIKTFRHPDADGWKRFVLQTNDGKLIPVIISDPESKSKRFVVITNPSGKDSISGTLINRYKKRGEGIAIVDLSGTGEASSPVADAMDGDMKFHTVSRAELLLGKTVMGEWVNELDAVSQFLKTNYRGVVVDLHGTKETGLAAIFFAALNGITDKVVVKDVPLSYLFDDRENINFYNMSVHLRGFLNWGDVSLAVALTGGDVEFDNALTMSGRKLNELQMKEFEEEYKKVRAACGMKGISDFGSRETGNLNQPNF